MNRSSNRSTEAEALTESKILRDKEISKASEDQTQKILKKVKHLYSATWQGVDRVTRQEVANFYEVSIETITTAYQRHKEEFTNDGVKVFRGKDLKDGKLIMSLPSTTSQELLFTPRSVLRMGFILRDSEIARQVRDVALNIIEGVGRILGEEVLQELIAGIPSLQVFSQQSKPTISVPLSDYWHAMKITQLEACYPSGGIPGLSAKAIRDRIMALSGCIDMEGWDFKIQKQLRYELTSPRYKYPDFSAVIPSIIDGVKEKVLFLFMFDNLIIREDYVEKCVGRNYISYAKEYLNINYAFLFFVAPFGATPDAEIYIREKWSDDKTKGCIGVLTVEELAKLLVNQARTCKNSNLVKGDIKKNFAEILDYRMPDPLSVLMGYRLT